MIQEHITQPTIIALAKITALLLITLATALLVKKPNLRATLCFCGIIATPLIFTLSPTQPLLKITTTKIKAPAPIEAKLTRSQAPPTSSQQTQNTSPQKSKINTTSTITPQNQPTSTQVTTTPTKSTNWLHITLITGAALTLLPFLISTLRIFLIKKQPASGRPLQIWNQLNHSKNKTLHFTTNATPPCAHGILSPKVLIPQDSTNWSDRRLRSVLTHELAHLERLDPLTRLISTLTKSAFWFHPLIWITHHKLIQAQEECCDQRALASGLNAEDYAEDLLFAASLTDAPFSQNISMAKWSQLGKRINIIISNKTQQPASMKTNLTIALLASGTALAIATTGITPDTSNVSSVKTIEGTTKAHKGKTLTFDFKDLPKHEALEISFTAQIVGPWDGNGFHRWGPDRLLAKLDNNTTLLDATFNNCHLIWPGNLWQSFPDPHHPWQNDHRKAEQYLYHGGEGASAIASLNHAWGSHKSLDSSYTLTYTVKHSADNANIAFSTIWNEAEANTTTYHIKDLTIKTLQTTPKITAEQEEEAWLTMFSGDVIASQKAWANTFAAHPDAFIKRAKSLVIANPDRIKHIIGKLKTGHTPTTAVSRDVFVSPSNPDAKNIYERISLLRELALSKDVWETDAQKFWDQSGGNEQTRAIRKALSTTMTQGPATIRAKMRITSYLRMLNTDASNRIAAQFDKTYTVPEKGTHTKASELAKLHNEARTKTIDPLKAKELADEHPDLQAAYAALPQLEIIIEPLVDGKAKAKPYTWKSKTHTEALTREELFTELVALHDQAPKILIIIHAQPTTKYSKAIQTFAEVKNLGFKYFKFINFQ